MLSTNLDFVKNLARVVIERRMGQEPTSKIRFYDEAKKVEAWSGEEILRNDSNQMTYERLGALQNGCIEETLFAAARWYDTFYATVTTTTRTPVTTGLQ